MKAVSKPTLYHATTRLLKGTHLLPPEHPLGTATSDTVQGKWLFARASELEAYGYALKTPDMASFNILSGEPPYVIIANASKFRKQTLNATILVMPSANNFYPDPYCEAAKAGQPTGEWLCETPVALADCQSISVTHADQAMQKGVQLLLLADGISHDQWKAEVTKRNHSGQELRAFWRDMIEKGILIHENAERDIKPVDLKTGKFTESFVEREDRRRSPAVNASLDSGAGCGVGR